MNLILISFLVLMVLESIKAHRDGAYFRNPDDGFRERKRWMQGVPGRVLITELALPGTHDSAAWGTRNDMLYTQCLSFGDQLRFGIRFFDIRIRHYRNAFPLHHGAFYLKKNFNDFLRAVQSFLVQNPSETVLFRLKEDHTASGNSRSMLATLDDYLRSYNRYLRTSNPNINLNQARGKFIILSDNGAFHSRGIPYGRFSRIQDDYHLTTNWDLYKKWSSVKNQLDQARNGPKNVFYINYLSGSGGSFPYFVASGHQNPGTSAPRLSTGLTTPAFRRNYPDFPRVSCFIGICTIAFEGTNILARDRIRNFNSGSNRRTVGIIVADFPGDDLIAEIIRNNRGL
jgi:1-phosphatidylinositol phosphodiesterase